MGSVLGRRRSVVPTLINVAEAPNGAASLLKITTADRPGLLVDIVRVLKVGAHSCTARAGSSLTTRCGHMQPAAGARDSSLRASCRGYTPVILCRTPACQHCQHQCHLLCLA
jgi:hypothetical protein